MIPGCGNWAGERKTELAGSRHCYHTTDYNFMLLGMLADRQLRLLEGGSIALVRPIENMYKNWETIRLMVMISFGVAREFPGAGVPPCLYTGRHAVQNLCHREAKPFRTTLP